jgi:hypothetical protein
MEAIAPLLTSPPALTRSSRKRSFDNSDKEDPSHGDPDHDDSASDLDVSGALNGLGYLSHHHHLVLGQDAGPKVK